MLSKMFELDTIIFNCKKEKIIEKRSPGIFVFIRYEDGPFSPLRVFYPLFSYTFFNVKTTYRLLLTRSIFFGSYSAVEFDLSIFAEDEKFLSDTILVGHRPRYRVNYFFGLHS